VTDGPTVDDVTKWMMGELEKGPLYQDKAAWEIKQRFGDEFVYSNDNGNPAIEKSVLNRFRKISGDGVVWSRGDFCWRLRTARDKPGRQQD
jgi:hypothetical protein